MKTVAVTGRDRMGKLALPLLEDVNDRTDSQVTA